MKRKRYELLLRMSNADSSAIGVALSVSITRLPSLDNVPFNDLERLRSSEQRTGGTYYSPWLPLLTHYPMRRQDLEPNSGVTSWYCTPQYWRRGTHQTWAGSWGLTLPSYRLELL